MRTKCEVYSRVCGYLRPVENWNIGKQEEYKDRKVFEINKNGKIKIEK
jgi:anaerobic ribonucleoside-triphosphate reductase